ncbi:hypothetical protein HYW44_05245 [Candidatus Daviesbacteria bacterium]|nr:hypothetical protein [Candidatus Daviesbacteria bacterium]
MPEATAVKPIPVEPVKPNTAPKESWVKYNDQDQADLQASVKNKLAQAGINHDPVPIEQRELPIHVPTGTGKTTSVSEKEGYVVPPDTFQNPGSNLLNHMIHGVDRTGTASEIVQHKEEKGDKLMKERNKANKGKISKFLDWFYEDKKAA